MTRIKDRAGYGRTMPARLWWLRLAPRWASVPQKYARSAGGCR